MTNISARPGHYTPGITMPGSGGDPSPVPPTVITVEQVVTAYAQNVFGILSCPIGTMNGSGLIAVAFANIVDQAWNFSQVWDARGNYWQQAGATAGNRYMGAFYMNPPYPAISIWYCPNAIGVTSVNVTMANQWDQGAIGLRVYEVTGLTNVSVLDVATVNGNSGSTHPTAAATTVNANDLVVGGFAVADYQAVTHTVDVFAGSSPVSLNGVTGDFNDSLTFDSVFNVATAAGAKSTQWTNPVSEQWVSIMAAFKFGAPVTTNANPVWPAVTTRAAFGWAPNDPQLGPVNYNSAHSADISQYVLSESATYGIPYELGSPEAGESRLSLYNQDGRFDPLNPNSPYAPYVLDFVPYRQLATWSGVTYGLFSGYVEQWPQTWDQDSLNTTNAVGLDALGTLARVKLKSCMQHEVLYDFPWGYWPMNDQQGSSFASNAGPGPGADMTLIPFHPRTSGNGTAGFGANTDLAGDPATGWGQQQDTPTNNQGWNLVSSSPPLVSGMQLLDANTSTFDAGSTSGWTVGSNCTLGITALAHSGAHAMIIQSNAAGTETISTAASYQAQRGGYYLFQAWYYAQTTGMFANLQGLVYDDHGNSVLSGSSNPQALTPFAWTSVTLKMFISPTATNVSRIGVSVALTGAVAGGAVVVMDDVTVTQQTGQMPSANIAPGAITCETWALFNVEAAKAQLSNVMALTDFAGNILMSLNISQNLPANSTVLQLAVLDNTSTRIVTNSAANARGFADARWHHYVVTMAYNGTTVWVDGVQWITTATVPANTDPAHFMIGGVQSNQNAPLCMAIGIYAHAAIYAGSLTAARINAHYQSGHDAFPEDTGSRINRLLGYAGWTGPRALDTGSSILSGCYSITGQYAAEAINDCVMWEYGMAWVDGLGRFRFKNRVSRFTQPSLGTFGDGPGEYHYKNEVNFLYDPTYQYNDIELTREGPGLSQGITFYSGDLNNTSLQYFDSTLQQTLALLSDTAILARIAFLYALLSVPQVRADQIVITPSADPSLWPVALGAQVGDAFTIIRRPMRAGQPTLTFPVVISSIAHDISPGSWTTTFTTLPSVAPGTSADAAVWRLDDPVASVLGTTTNPGW